jgi:hypothetical protein
MSSSTTLLTSSPSTPGYSPQRQQMLNHHGVDPAFLPGSPLRRAATLQEPDVVVVVVEEEEETLTCHHNSTIIVH